jgi:nucleoside-diphosphate-sugar epimerase
MASEPLTPGATVLVTGAGGFVGRAAVPALKAAGYRVRAVGRHEIGDIHRGTDWRAALEGCSAVLHLAGRVHVMDAGRADLEAFREVNLHGTAALARQAAEAGVGRFVFISSIKVLGESGLGLTPEAPPDPQDPYAVSKAEAEAAVQDLAGSGGGAVILRPPLVHGPGVGGNMARLMRWIAAGRPLPFGGVDNRRSILHVENLASACCAALGLPAGIYYPKDPEDVSTPAMIRALAEGMACRPRLLSVPPALLRAGAGLLGRGAEIARLTGSFTSDGAMGSWTAPRQTVEALRATGRAFRDAQG